MSSWRRHALELFPDLRDELQDPDATIYTAFFELLPRCREAHDRCDDEELTRIHAFAAWCFRQNSEDLRNAAGVAFYEHLADSRVTLREMPKWVEPDIFADILPLDDRARPGDGPIGCVVLLEPWSSRMDEDLERMSREQLIDEVKARRRGIRRHRDGSRHELCWHHPELWGLLPEKTDPVPVVPEWPRFLEGCIRYRLSLDEQARDAPRTSEPYAE